MKSLAVILIVAMFFASALMVPSTQVQASEKEYKELNPTLVHTGIVGDVACYGNKLAWSSGWYNITTSTATGSGMSTFPANYYTSYGDFAMSDQAIVWSNVKDYEQPDIYYSTGGSALSMPTNTDRSDSNVRIDGSNIIYEGGTDVSFETRYATLGSASYTTIPGGRDISGNNLVVIDENTALQVVNTAGTLQKDLGEGYSYQQVCSLRISGDYLVYYNLTDFGRGANIYVKNWKTGTTDCIIFQMQGFPGGLDIEGNFVVFSAFKSPELKLGGICVFIYDIQAKKTFQVSPEYSAIYDVAIGGGRIAWVADPETATEDTSIRSIYTAQLPAPGAAPVIDPITIDPGDESLDLGNIITRNISLGVTGSTQTINSGEGVIFTSNNEEHALVITGITGTGATIDVYSDPISLTMATGETKEVDTNGNGVNDLSVTLNSVDTTGQTADVTISSLSDGGSLIPFPGFGMITFLIIFLGLTVALVRRRNLYRK